MKTWNNPVIEELNLNQTEANRTPLATVGLMTLTNDDVFSLPSGKGDDPEILA